MKKKKQTKTMYIDHIPVEVSYTTPAPPSGGILVQII